MTKAKRDKKETNGNYDQRPMDPHHDEHHGHKPHVPPYYNPDYECPPVHGHKPPDNPRCPDHWIYGTYASKNPPSYVPHPFEHACFKPRKEDYKPPTTCNHDDDSLCVRKDHRALTADEQGRFLNAFAQINAMNALGPLVDIHSNALHQMHSNPRFLPWHRIYLLRIEALLMTVDPTVCIPYWKSSEEQAFPSWLLAFTPTVASAMSNTTFNAFAQAVEGIHNSGHVWVGGHYGRPPNRARGPSFLDASCRNRSHRAQWQTSNPGQHPPLAGTAAIMDPWTETEVDTRGITSLGYRYA